MTNSDQLQHAADRLAEVWKHATESFELFGAMAWVEADALAWMLHEAGHSAIAADILGAWWLNDPEADEHDDAYRQAMAAFEAAS